MPNLTEMEIEILKGIIYSDYNDERSVDSYPWTFSVISKSGIEEKKARGVLSSLIKKGLIEVYDWDSDSVTELTDEGKDIVNNLITNEWQVTL